MGGDNDDKTNYIRRAMKESERLQHYEDLIESYPEETIENRVIKEYAITNSIIKVTEKLNLEREYAVEIIKSCDKDELHKLVRSGYMSKTRASRSKNFSDEVPALLKKQ